MNKIEVLKFRNKEIVLGEKTLIMGILNVTPDSFSDGGKYFTIENALKQAKQMITEGADIIDVGGQSTRPGYKEISVKEEINRIVTIIEELTKLDIIISLDTYKYQVAEAGLKAGAHILNDIWGLQYDNGEMAKIAKKYDVPIIAMHNKKDRNYEDDIIFEIKKFFGKTFKIAEKYGISKEKIILDPGIGFGKGIDENIEVLSRLEELRDFGRILLGTSNKRFLGSILEESNPEKRILGTVATTVIGIQKGIDIVRVHNVLENKQASLVADAVYRKL